MTAPARPAKQWTLSERTPLRLKLVAVMLALVTLALLVTGVFGWYSLRGYLYDRVDDQLIRTAHGPGGRPPDGGSRGDDDGDAGHPAPTVAFYQVTVSAAGELGTPTTRYPSGSSQTEPDLPIMDSSGQAAYANKPFTVAPTGAGHDWRVLVVPLEDGGSNVVALSLDDVDATVGRLVWIELWVSLAVLLALAVIGYVAVRRSLRRLVEVEETAEAIAAGDLTRRVRTAPPRTEVGRLAGALNTMLGQIETAFRDRQESEREARASEERMRRFVADASHELRTPLTSIRGFSELYRSGAVSSAQTNHVMQRVEAEATRMGLLVEDLLLLARLDQQRELEHLPVDLLAVAEDAVGDAQVTAKEHVLSLERPPDGTPAVVLGDESRLRQIAANLLANAVTHTPPGTTVTVRVLVEDSDVVFEVADSGPGMTEEEAERIFERFYRTEPSRARSLGGAGLGLSIVASLVAAHDGRVSVESAPGQGARFRVALPRFVPSAAPHPDPATTVAP